VHGHFLPTTTAVWDDGFPIGVWAKNSAQQPARRVRTPNGARTGTLPSRELWRAATKQFGRFGCGGSGMVPCLGGARLPPHACARSGRRDTARAGGRGHRAGRRPRSLDHRATSGWDKLMPAQQWLLDSVVELEPTSEEEQQPVRRTQADRGPLTSPRPASSTPARPLERAPPGTLRRCRARAGKAVRLYDWAGFWTTPGAGPTSSPPNAAPHAPRHALVGLPKCKGRRNRARSCTLRSPRPSASSSPQPE
jgi:hypothetical protein